MINSVKCEIYKGFSQLKMLIFSVIIAGAPLVVAVVTLLLSKSSGIVNDPQLANTIMFTSVELPLRMLEGLIGLLIPLFIIILVTDSFTEEYTNGTLKLPLLTPMRREKLVFTKFIAIAIEIAVLLGVLLVSSYVTGYIVLGESSKLLYGDKTLTILQGIFYTIGAYGIAFSVLLAFAVVIMNFAIKFRTTGSVIAISISFLLAMQVIAAIGETTSKFMLSSYFKFYNVLFVSIDKLQIIKDFGIVALYGIAGLLLSIFIFKQKDIIY